MTTTSTPQKPVAIDVSGDSEDSEPTATLTVLIADKFESTGVDALEKLGCTVSAQADLSGDALATAIQATDPDVLIVRSTKVNEDIIKAADGLSLIVRAGAGYDTIDVDAASKRGIFVANCPGKNAIAVAEVVWGLILSCDRRIPDQTAELRDGRWNKKEYSKANGLFGRTLGIVGLGTIGNEVAKRGKAFGMNIVAWSRSLSEESAANLGVGYCATLEDLAKQSDVVSVNCAATPATEHLIDREFCAAMKPGAYFINTSRGSVVDESALSKAIEEKGVRAGLDVYADEPGSGDKTFKDDIVKHAGVYGTHHVGASTEQAQQAIAAEAVRVIQTYIKSGQVPNCVNRAEATVATYLLTVRHLNRPGVLAHVFYALGQAGINVEEMENLIYQGEDAACARIQLTSRPDDEIIASIKSNENVLSVDLSAIR